MAATTSSDLSLLDDSTLETIIAALSLSDRARLERTCQRCRRVSRDMVMRERATLQRGLRDSIPDVIASRLDAGVQSGTLIEVVRLIMQAALDVSAVFEPDPCPDASGDASGVILEVIYAGTAPCEPRSHDTVGMTSASRHRRSMFEIGTELYRFVLWYARSDHLPDGTVGRIVRMPTALSVDWEFALDTSALDPASRAGPDARSTIEELAPLHDAALRGFCHIADSVEEYFDLIPSSAGAYLDRTELSVAGAATPTMGYIVDSFAPRMLDVGNRGLMDTIDYLSLHRLGRYSPALIARLAIRIAESEGLSMSLIDIAERTPSLMPPITRFISVGGWWRKPIDTGLGRPAGADATPGSVIGALLMWMANHPHSHNPVRLAARTVIDELAKITPFAAEYPSLSPMSLLTMLTRSLVVWLGGVFGRGADGTSLRGSTWWAELIGEMFRYIPAGRTAPLASSEDTVGLLHVDGLDWGAIHVITRACGIPLDGLGAIEVFTLARRYRWDPSAITALHDDAVFGRDAPPYRDIIRYLDAMTIRYYGPPDDGIRPGRPCPGGERTALMSIEDHAFAWRVIWASEGAGSIAEPPIRMDETKTIIDEYERRWPRSWHFRPL